MLLDYIAGTVCMITAVSISRLKVFNERIFPGHPQNLVFRLMVEAQRFARHVGLAGPALTVRGPGHPRSSEVVPSQARSW